MRGASTSFLHDVEQESSYHSISMVRPILPDRFGQCMHICKRQPFVSQNINRWGSRSESSVFHMKKRARALVARIASSLCLGRTRGVAAQRRTEQKYKTSMSPVCVLAGYRVTTCIVQQMDL